MKGNVAVIAVKIKSLFLGMSYHKTDNTKFRSLTSSSSLILKNLTQNSQLQYLLMFVSPLKHTSSLMISLHNLLQLLTKTRQID